MQIHIVAPNNLRPIQKLVRQIERQHNRQGKIRLEPILRSLSARHFSVAYWCEARPELADEDEDVKYYAYPGTYYACLGAEGEFVKGVALDGPGFAEADV